jgi:hypothetical protein
MNVLVLNTEFPSSPWRRAFADALIRLRPELNPDVADELSDSAFLRLADQEPGSAARFFSRELDARPVGGSGREQGLRGRAG